MRSGFVSKIRQASGEIFRKKRQPYFQALLYAALLVIILLAVFAVMEFRYPYYFLQDDNRDFYLPVFVHNFESVIKGELPLYNFHQFLGTPTMPSGQLAALYPITYLAVLLSRLFFGHYFAAIDIQVIFHLIVGALGFYYMLKTFGAGNKASFFGALTWPLNSFVIYSSNSWVIVAGIAAYLPWMAAFSLRLCINPVKKNITLLVVARLLMFYTGHIQYFVYSIIFEVLMFVSFWLINYRYLKRKELLVKSIAYYAVASICTVILSLPLLLPMWHQMSISATRNERLEFKEFFDEHYDISQWISGLLFPYRDVTEETKWAFRRLLNLSHIGYITLPFLIISFLFIFRRKGMRLKRFVPMFWILGLLSFLWSMSEMFNTLIYQIPILNRFRWPFKLQFFTAFFMIAAGASGICIFMKMLRGRTARKIAGIIIIMIQIVNFIALYTLVPQRNFGKHLDELPLQEPLQKELSNGRIVSAGFNIWAPDLRNYTGFKYRTASTLGFNYASLWGLYHFAGYDPLVSYSNQEACLDLNFDAIYTGSQNIPLAYFREWGVKWYVVDNAAVTKYKNVLNSRNYITQKYKDDMRTVFYDEKAKPMVFREKSQSEEGMEYDIRTNKINLQVNLPEDDRIIINFLYNPFFKAYVDGVETDVVATDANQMSVKVSKGIHSITLKYSDPYFNAGCLIASAFIMLLAAFRLLNPLTGRIVWK